MRQYVNPVRDVEQRIQKAEKQDVNSKFAVDRAPRAHLAARANTSS